MKVIPHEASDLFRLRQLCQSELNAKQRDRYRVVLLAAEPIGEKEMTREQIAVVLSRSRQFVDEWVKRYRCGGIDALRAKKQPGRPAFLSSDQKEQLTQLLSRGPVAGEDPRCVYFGQDIRKLIQRHFKVLYSLGRLSSSG